MFTIFLRFVFTLVLRSESKVDTHIYVDGCAADRSVVGRFVFTHGNICTTNRVGEAAPGAMDAAVASMTTLNKSAAEISRSYDVHAATDVTGFSFLGHLHEMMGGRLSCRIDGSAVPVLPGAWQAADDCLYTAAGQRNRNHTGPFVRFENVPFAMQEILFDPQTSGGLLLAVAPKEAESLRDELQKASLPAQIVGEITEKQDTEIFVSYSE